MPYSINSNRVPLLISIGLFSYFVLLVMVNYFRWDFVLVGVFVELLTIPALCGVLGLFGYSIYRSFRGAPAQKPVYRITAGILFACISMLVAATMYFN